MDLTKLKEPLGIEDIDFRVQSINKGGYATILAYKDARVDMNRLDKVVGPANWQRDHKEIKNVIYCGIGILCTINLEIEDQLKTDNEKRVRVIKEWVWKWDAGAESFTEKQKGEASDSFKRAGFNWGIGRELYDYPKITIQLSAVEYNFQTGKVTWDFKLREWIWFSQFTDGKLTYLACKDERGKARFTFGEYKKEN